MIRAKTPITPEKALRRLEDQCARSEVCSGEAKKKLANWAIGSSDAERIIRSLIERRYIDDRRFCSAFVRDKLYFSHWGKRKISLALYQKRLNKDIISEAIEGIDPEDYMAILKKIVLTKAKTIQDSDTYDGRTKLFRFGVSRGFEPELIARVIRETTVR